MRLNVSGDSKRFVRKRFADELAGVRPLNVAVVGYGYWGPNLVRNVTASPSLELAALCERDPDRGYTFRSRVPDVPIKTDFDKLLLDPRLDAVLVATPPSTHYALCRHALQAGKHVLDEATHPPRSGSHAWSAAASHPAPA